MVTFCNRLAPGWIQLKQLNYNRLWSQMTSFRGNFRATNWGGSTDTGKPLELANPFRCRADIVGGYRLSCALMPCDAGVRLGVTLGVGMRGDEDTAHIATLTYGVASRDA